MSNSVSFRDYPKAKSFLFVSGIKKDDFKHCFVSEADAIVIDLEDSVPAERKKESRANVLEFCRLNSDKKFFIRVNDAQSDFFNDDMVFIRELGLKFIMGIMLSKAEQKEHIESVLKNLGEVPIILLIESALGLQNLNLIAAHPCVKQLAFGAFDMILDLGLKDGYGKDFVLNYARVQMILSSRIYNLLPPINRVFPNTKDESKFKTHLEFVYSMGFSGALTFYPNQLSIINEIFSQGDKESEWAKEVLRLSKLHKGEPFSFEGNRVDISTIKKAQGILKTQY